MDTGRKRPRLISGRFSPLRYPGGKGKLAGFLAELIRRNGIQDGLYVEPYAGGAAVAWELLLTGVVRFVHINDLSEPIYAFWYSVLNHTEELIRLIEETPVDVTTWNQMKKTFSEGSYHSHIDLGFATFFLNRTNRSGILNGGPIGGKAQTGDWGIGARYNKIDLIERIRRIARARRRITLSNLDAVELICSRSDDWSRKTLVYLDPPYHEKGRHLYYDFYREDDHAGVALAVRKLENACWVVSYDDVLPIHALYPTTSWLQYRIGYSARERVEGREAMFFSPGLRIPPSRGSMVEIDRCELFPEEGAEYRAPSRTQLIAAR